MFLATRNPSDVVSTESVAPLVVQKNLFAVHIIFYGLPSVPIIRVDIHTEIIGRSPICSVINQVDGIEGECVLVFEQIQRRFVERLAVAN